MSEEAQAPRGRVVGVDYGTVRIGLALGERSSGLVMPLPVMPHPGSEEAVVERLAAVAQAHDATRVVIGDPLHMTGESSPMSLVVSRLAEGLRAALPELPFQPEALIELPFGLVFAGLGLGVGW